MYKFSHSQIFHASEVLFKFAGSDLMDEYLRSNFSLSS